MPDSKNILTKEELMTLPGMTLNWRIAMMCGYRLERLEGEDGHALFYRNHRITPPNIAFDTATYIVDYFREWFGSDRNKLGEYIVEQFGPFKEQT